MNFCHHVTIAFDLDRLDNPFCINIQKYSDTVPYLTVLNCGRDWGAEA